jgi:hypothetical protein
VIDANDASITKTMWCFQDFCGFSSQHHYQAVVICGVVYMKDIVLVDLTAFEQYLIKQDLRCIVAVI